ncbi:MAG: hypothetical protein H6736_05155 [Alphaproteobacteria bacterium]|nr:hypothetical protein [Alphaproteobacteria bacterium]MCB9691185.1 hypothetical protein [Alphaproteobacteria bacterium]
MWLVLAPLALAAQGDDCSDPIPLSPGNTIGTTVGRPSAVASTCVTSVTAPGTWYSFTPPADGDMVLSTCNQANYDSKISAYDGTCGALGCLAGNDDTNGCGLTSQVTYAVTGGVENLVLVHGFGAATGNYTLSATFTPYTPFAEPPMDCAGLDSQLCGLVDDLVEQVNTEAGMLVLTEGASSARFRPTNLYTRLLPVLMTARANTCGVVVTGGGEWDSRAGTWSGTDNSGFFGTVTTSGTLDTRARSFAGSGLLGPYGNRFATYRGGKVAGSGGSGDELFTMGVWTRRTGTQGVYTVLVGACSSGDYADHFEPWFGAPLP